MYSSSSDSRFIRLSASFPANRQPNPHVFRGSKFGYGRNATSWQERGKGCGERRPVTCFSCWGDDAHCTNWVRNLLHRGSLRAGQVPIAIEGDMALESMLVRTLGVFLRNGDYRDSVGPKRFSFADSSIRRPPSTRYERFPPNDARQLPHLCKTISSSIAHAWILDLQVFCAERLALH